MGGGGERKGRGKERDARVKGERGRWGGRGKVGGGWEGVMIEVRGREREGWGEGEREVR